MNPTHCPTCKRKLRTSDKAKAARKEARERAFGKVQSRREKVREIRNAVLERSGNQCELGVACLAREVPDSLEWHHLESGSGRRQQQEAVSNTMMACRACHRGYHHDPETFRFAVEEWAKAFGYPVPSRFRNAPLPRRGTA